MAVEIQILSGDRQGERVLLDATNFRVGANADCAVFFDPQLHKAAADRSATFNLMEDGWYIVHTTGAILLNQRTVAGPTRVRSGDVVRMSESGPDFAFKIVASVLGWKKTLSTQDKPPSAPVPSGDTSVIVPHQEEIATISGAMPEIKSAATSSLQSQPSANLAAIEQNATKSGIKDIPPPVNITINNSSREIWLILALGIIAICIAIPFFTGKLGRIEPGGVQEPGRPAPPSPPLPEFNLTGPTSGKYETGQPINITWMAANVPANSTINLYLDPDQTPSNDNERWIEVDKVSATDGNGSYTFDSSGFTPGTYFIGGYMHDKATDKKTNARLNSSISIIQSMEERLKDAVFLIQVENSDKSWPFATCCAIGKNTLLTSAREAVELYQLQNDPEIKFKIWVTNPASGVKMEVQDIKVNALYIALADKPTDCIYYDLALLKVAEQLPKIIPLASLEETAKLKDGFPLYCCGYEREEKPQVVTDFDSFKPQLVHCKVFAITAPPELTLHPRLLHVKGTFIKNAFGNPLVTDQGKIVAVYGTTIQPKGMEKINLAPIINAELIAQGLNGKDEKMWITPDIIKPDSEQKDEK